ncbi:LptF/LptG family permease [Kaustia mangrovi]|uniref:LptF/LptG family permease n=1 Tax=Kaustia mangrovi TaxID=2593653 RepID=A0A7S8C6I0_9HYPH|nr:LptF/LptG family permease [Kaustia mangrovi]QPC44242.1 LptF/LptG family permease [Kaustia mangrovi]
MWTLSWMLTRMFVVRFIVILLGISVFIVTLDAVAHSGDILALKDNDMTAVAYYGLLRLPGVASSFINISALLAMLLLLTELSANSELVAIWASGVSQFRVIGMFVPIALLVGGVQFLVNDQAVPWAAPTLHDWGIGDYGKKKLKVGEGDPIWMRSGNDILRAVSSNPQATELDEVIIFRRDPDGVLLEQVMANHAELTDGRWELSDVTIYYQENLPPSHIAKLIYSGLLRPAAVGARSGDPEEMTISDLDYFIENGGFGIRPTQVYETWWHKRFTLFVTALLMVALAVPLSAHYRRGGGLGVMFAIGVALGFGFFILEGLSMTIGELGIMAPWMAAWMPIFIFTATAGMLAFRAETI